MGTVGRIAYKYKLSSMLVEHPHYACQGTWPALAAGVPLPASGKRVQVVVTICFPINFSLYDSQSLDALDTSRRNVFILDSP